MDINNAFMPNPEIAKHQQPEQKPMVIYGGPLFDGKGNLYKRGCLYIENGKVKEIGTEEDVFPLMPRNKQNIDLIDTQGKVIFPGLINTHHHFYSAFAKGLSPLGPIKNFQKTLEKLWWPLDKALDKESIQLSSLISLLDCIESGVTTVFDHHASPSFITGSLKIISSAVEKAGINAVLCHEISDRNGKKIFKETLEENLNFIDEFDQHPSIRGILGLHANFTLSENSMKTISKNFHPDVGIHIHCGEDKSDITFCKDLGYKGCIDRLNKHKLLSNKTILAHGLHLSRPDITILEKCQGMLIHNPESNANNNVGILQLPMPQGLMVGLGTDGMSSNMLQSLRAAYILHRHNKKHEDILFNNLPNFLFYNNSEFASRFFDHKHGTLEKGIRADVVIFDYVPYTPINSDNLFGHVIFGMNNVKASTVITHGKIIFKDGTFYTLDKQLIIEESKKASKEVWQRYYS